MKKLLIVIVSLFLLINCFGQNDSIIVYSYIEVLTYGTKSKPYFLKQDGIIIVDKNNMNIEFDSPAKGLNYMIRQGWKLEDFEIKNLGAVFLISRKEPIKPIEEN